MSTKPFDAPQTTPRKLAGAAAPRSFRNTIAVFFQAIGEGHEAYRRYQLLLGRGLPADRAAGIAFNETFAKR